MVAYHQQLSEAGVLLDGAGLRPSRDGWRIPCSSGFPSPFGDTDCEIEVRQLWETKDFPPGDAIDTFRSIIESKRG